MTWLYFVFVQSVFVFVGQTLSSELGPLLRTFPGRAAALVEVGLCASCVISLPIA
jgi:hypothetical protein